MLRGYLNKGMTLAQAKAEVKEWVTKHIFHKYEKTITQFTRFDPTSIMLYEIKPEFTRNHYSAKRCSVLSSVDKSFIAALYPPFNLLKPSPPPPPSLPPFLPHNPSYTHSRLP